MFPKPVTVGASSMRFKKELHALVWVKIAEVADRYRDQGYKVSTWLTLVVDNKILDFFETRYNRQRLAPTFPLIEGFDPARPGDVLPAKRVGAKGASHHDAALNDRQAAWDRKQNWPGFTAPPKPKRSKKG